MLGKKFIAIVFIILFQLHPSIMFSQKDRETRAVWVSTNFRLDWPPPTYDHEKQKQALIQIFDNIKEKKLNTVYFQTRSNGTVLFKSSYEPLSPHITGKIGLSASYDPLQFAIEQAHYHGLEIHAWINVVRCFTGTEISTLNDPHHIYKRKPEWVIEDFRDGVKSFWLDTGLPEVREYLSNLILELAKNYDIDGVQLDFIRYPGRDFDDDFSYNIYGNGQNRDDWRRNNISSLVEMIYKKVKSVKQFIKIGAAPIGVYKNFSGMTGWESYSQIYQDTREWLKRGLIDYVVPQIYWSFDDNTRFDLLAKDWVENSFGRNVVLGIGAFKENVKPEMEKMIEYSRSINSDGVAFFRYSDIAGVQFQNFAHKTLPPSMNWLDTVYPEPPEKFTATISEKNKIHFEWQSKSDKGDDSISYYALYSLPHPSAEQQSDYLVDIIPADNFNYSLSLSKLSKINYYFALKSVSKFWNESVEASNIASIKINELASFIYQSEYDSKPILIKNNGSKPNLLLYSSIDGKIEVTGINKKGIVEKSSFSLSAGKNIFELPFSLQDLSVIKVLYLASGKEFELKL